MVASSTMDAESAALVKDYVNELLMYEFTRIAHSGGLITLQLDIW
jgi:hypothetical protein